MNENEQLGLCDPPVAVYIFVGETSEKCLWYTLESDSDTQIPVHERALKGRLCEVRRIEKEYRGRVALKLELVIQADRQYVVRSGFDTAWSRGMLLALAQVLDFTAPLYFCVRPADTEKVVFSALYTSKGEQVKAEWDKERDLHAIVTTLRARLGNVAAEGAPHAEKAPAARGANGNAEPAPKRQVAVADLHERIGVWRKKLREEAFETASSLNQLLGEYGCTHIGELTREDAIRHGTQLRTLYERHVRERAEKSVVDNERSR